MSRRILSVVVTVLGLVLVALAVCSATIWKPGSKVEAKLASGPSQPYVFTAPGVLSGVGSDVTVTASSSDGKDVHLFVARAADLDAWMSPDADRALPYTVVTRIDADAGSLSSKDETKYCPSASAASAQAGATPSSAGTQCSERKANAVTASGSDIWLGEKTGGSSVTFNTAEDADRAMLPRKDIDEQIVVMAMTDGKAPAPSLTVTWERQVETPWYFYGGWFWAASSCSWGHSCSSSISSCAAPMLIGGPVPPSVQPALPTPTPSPPRVSLRWTIPTGS